MLDFDEEIQKFQPSLEVEDAEDAIYKNDVPDITDLINKIIEGRVRSNYEMLQMWLCPFSK